MKDEEIKMIPTSGRTKIPSALSFVASAKTLSVTLQDVPQFEVMQLRFCCNVPKSLRIATTPRVILELRLWDLSWFGPLQDQSRLTWDVQVGTCRREDAHEVRDWLHENGFELLRQWLLNNSSINDEHRNVYWRATFDEDSHEFHTEHRE